ncbi:glycosyltransferase [Patescibacteria group bacterium]|nr:glycosyltransferase [Patescibacteria group bacterium]
MSNILVIIPTYNEQDTIIPLVNKLFSLHLNLDILAVDDGGDKTASLIEQKQLAFPNLYLIKRQSKAGRGSAVLAGLQFGLQRDYQFFVEMDADFSHQPEELPELLKLAVPNSVVIGSRYVEGSKIKNWPISRRVFSRLANFYAELILKIGIHDYTNGYRVYSREAVQKIDFLKIKSSGYIVLSEIAYQLFKKGVKFFEHKTLFINRSRGQSSFSLNEVKESFLSVLRIKKDFR